MQGVVLAWVVLALVLGVAPACVGPTWGVQAWLVGGLAGAHYLLHQQQPAPQHQQSTACHEAPLIKTH
jgi:hypothetical protein